jgi:hypothetical protein
MSASDDGTSRDSRVRNVSYVSQSLIMSWVSTAASVGMAVGPPLVYADQAASIIRKK